jgi:lipoprotein-releasing system permease protein
MRLWDIAAIALRYTFAFGRGYLSTFLSLLSVLGLVLAIALLIVVLSVMNGFDREMRERILSLVPHVTLYSHLAIEDPGRRQAQIGAHPDVLRVNPFSRFDALLMRGNTIETAVVVGLAAQATATELAASLPAPAHADFVADPRGIVLGVDLAQGAGLRAGDTLTLIVPPPGGRLTSRSARFEAVTVRGLLSTGTELDQAAAFMHLPLATELASATGEITGFQVYTRDIFDVARVAWELVNDLPPGFYGVNWMMTHGNLYSAIQLSRRLVSVLLFSIIAVAAFNVVSSLVLVVFDKQRDIAILRTLGASPGDVGLVFLFQGALIGLVGVMLGSLLGIAGSLVVTDVVAGLEALLDIRFLRTDVYPVSFLPADLLLTDVLVVGAVAFGMCVLSAIYPARRAAGLSPAIILHQE